MPLPLIPVLLGGAALASAAFGAKKGYDAYQDTKEAQEWHEYAQRKYKQAEKELDEARENAQNKFEELGTLQSQIVSGVLREYQEIIDKLDIQGAKSLQDAIRCEEFNLAKTRDSIVSLQTALTGVVGGIVGGVAAGFGAFGSAGLLATASTGTAISTLSGVAATNATLAWFGGGSLAAGGLGIAGGTLVLGSIVAAPVILVAGTIFAASAEKKKYDAEAYANSIRVLQRAMNAESMSWQHMANRTTEKIDTIRDGYMAMSASLSDVSNIIYSKGLQVSQWAENEQMTLKTMMQVAETLVTTINSPLMNDEDKLTIELKQHQEKCQQLMEHINRKWGE